MSVYDGSGDSVLAITGMYLRCSTPKRPAPQARQRFIVIKRYDGVVIEVRRATPEPRQASNRGARCPCST